MTTQLTTTSPACRAGADRRAAGRSGWYSAARPIPIWARPALWAVLVLAAVLYAGDLSRNGDANAFYAAAVLSGTESWKAFFYGSLDSASFITVDKPPFAFWVMGISARVFGFNSWSLLLPQAAEGVAAVAVVYAAVRRSVARLTGERGAHAAGLIAALALTLTPVVVAIDRDDNPDTMLTLPLASGAWALLESLRAGGPPGPLRGDPKRGRGRARVQHEDARGVHPAARVRRRVPGRGEGAARSDRPAAGRGRRAGRDGAVLDDHRRPHPQDEPSLVGSSSNDTVWNLAVGYNGFGRITGGGSGGSEGGGVGGARKGGLGNGAGRGAGIGTETGTGRGAGFGTGTGAGQGTAVAEVSRQVAQATSAASPTGSAGQAVLAARQVSGECSPRHWAARSPGSSRSLPSR